MMRTRLPHPDLSGMSNEKDGWSEMRCFSAENLDIECADVEKITVQYKSEGKICGLTNQKKKNQIKMH